MSITSAQLQTALGTNPMNARVLKTDGTGTWGTVQRWYVMGNVDAPGRARWVETTASDDAATQAAAVLVALRT